MKKIIISSIIFVMLFAGLGTMAHAQGVPSSQDQLQAVYTDTLRQVLALLLQELASLEQQLHDLQVAQQNQTQNLAQAQGAIADLQGNTTPTPAPTPSYTPSPDLQQLGSLVPDVVQTVTSTIPSGGFQAQQTPTTTVTVSLNPDFAPPTYTAGQTHAEVASFLFHTDSTVFPQGNNFTQIPVAIESDLGNIQNLQVTSNGYWPPSASLVTRGTVYHIISPMIHTGETVEVDVYADLHADFNPSMGTGGNAVTGTYSIVNFVFSPTPLMSVTPNTLTGQPVTIQ